MSKLKVFFAIESLAGGGAEKVLLNILNKFDFSKYEVTLFVFFPGGVYEKYLDERIKLITFYNNIQKVSSSEQLLYKLYRSISIRLLTKYPKLLTKFQKGRLKEQYDIGVSFCEGLNAAIIMENSSKFFKKIGWVHIDFNLHNANISNKDILYYYKKFDKIAFVSADSLKAFKNVFPTISKPIFQVVYNPINVPEIKLKSRMQNPFIKNKFTVISVGRFNKQKRFDRVIDIAKLAKAENLNIQFLIVGEGSLKEDYINQIKNDKLEDFVEIHPFTENVVAWVNYSDLYLMTSDYEGLPVVICEAMVIAKPIIATRITGTVELLENGKYGQLVDKDINEIYKAVKNMYQDPILRSFYSVQLSNDLDNFIFKDDIKNVIDFLTL